MRPAKPPTATSMCAGGDAEIEYVCDGGTLAHLDARGASRPESLISCADTSTPQRRRPAGAMPVGGTMKGDRPWLDA